MSDNVWNKVLDEGNSEEFIAKAKPKTAILQWEGAHYSLNWGEQTFDGPHMVIDGDDHKYGCELEVFFTTHEPLAKENTWRKSARVRARRVKVDTDLVTILKGREEARSTVQAGGWIVQNPGGEQYYNAHEEFLERYRAV